jgi:signal transduction histidine kinase
MDALTPATPRLSDVRSRGAEAKDPPAFGLSWRLLILTIIFVMMAEILILVPSLARYRLDYLSEKIDAAYLIMSALEASPDRQSSSGQIDPNLRDRLLDQAGMLGMTVLRPNMPPRTLGPRVPPQIPVLYDLRGAMTIELTADALGAMATKESTVVGVTNVSRSDQRVVVEVVLDEFPLSQALWAHFRELLVVSIFISITTAALVYASLQWLAVRPLRRLTLNMTRFRDDPQDPRRVISPTARGDEVGTAEHALSDMQHQLRALLIEKDRLAGVGFAVTKISHDLKNILTTAQLESDRLENAPNVDPEIKRITQGIVRSIDRAVKLSANTIKFAREGLPESRRQQVVVSTVVADLVGALQSTALGVAMTQDIPANLSLPGDPELLQRALENLIRNALEAGAKQISLTHERTATDHIVLVSDNGSGLPKKAKDNLFVPFSGSAKAGGTGLGLPIAREAMRVQGGDLVLRATSPAGTTFAVLLPVA